ncbi:hypothetical protein Taro_036639 [Colocasia esculenta]|uniref:Uncharacterized protein n=1 Tax=Colocasia esculenta TaxID=4460 RepID=A0A843W238_COLES|nr:hypothetical protein [Colocasia esculenta]
MVCGVAAWPVGWTEEEEEERRSHLAPVRYTWRKMMGTPALNSEGRCGSARSRRSPWDGVEMGIRQGFVGLSSHIFVLVVSTLDQSRSTLVPDSRRLSCKTGTAEGQVDTSSGQVDTRPSFQQTSLQKWDNRSTLY